MSDKTNISNKENQPKTEKLDLGLLEEDDEFEEFPAEGNFYLKITIFNVG